jgi:uroporphyrinogen decarboxylase
MERRKRMNAMVTAPQIGSVRLRNALSRATQPTPPIWLMRQAGRYHSHYQNLRRRYSFMDLCKHAELAAEVALGPVRDFDFDAAILFSDLLFPLEALGMGLHYSDHGPELGWRLDQNNMGQLRDVEEAWPNLFFQGEALRATRALLPADRSLIGFVGGPWTLFAYAIEGSHSGTLARSKKLLSLFPTFCETLVPLLIKNIELQLESGAELVMIFDTAAGELSPEVFTAEVVPQLERITEKNNSRIGYYSKGTQPAHLHHPVFTDGFAGIGVDYRWELRDAFDLFPRSFVQGNFDPTLLLCEADELKNRLYKYLEPLLNHARTGWVCGLGHGVPPGTPEENVRLFVKTVREVFA